MYILFKPAGENSNYVSLRRLNWSWEGTARKNADGEWKLVRESAKKTNYPSVESFGDPKWKTNSEDYKFR